MRATIAILATLALLAGAGAATAAARRHPRLTLTDVHPVSVRGHGFHARERVRVVLRTAGREVVRRIRATRHGNFTATFPMGLSGPCGRFSIVAWGARSGRVVLRHVMQPACIVR